MRGVGAGWACGWAERRVVEGNLLAMVGGAFNQMPGSGK